MENPKLRKRNKTLLKLKSEDLKINIERLRTKMESVSNMIRVSLPNYFSNLPVPSSFGGWFSLSVGDWMRLIPFGVTVGGLSYLSLKGLANTPVVGPYIQNTMSKVPGFQPARINNQIKLDSPKV